MVGATEGGEASSPPPHSTTLGPTTPYFFPISLPNPVGWQSCQLHMLDALCLQGNSSALISARGWVDPWGYSMQTGEIRQLKISKDPEPPILWCSASANKKTAPPPESFIKSTLMFSCNSWVFLYRISANSSFQPTCVRPTIFFSPLTTNFCSVMDLNALHSIHIFYSLIVKQCLFNDATKC